MTVARRNTYVSEIATVDPRTFWLQAEKVRGGCWEWRGSRGGTTYAYGRKRVLGRLVGAHRIAWVMVNDKSIEWPHEICHHCDNPRCVNPAHLYLGTQVTNVDDRVRRQRGGLGSFIEVEGEAA